MASTAIFLPVVTSGPYNRSLVQLSNCFLKRRRLYGHELLRPQSFRVRSSEQDSSENRGSKISSNCNISDSQDKISIEDEKMTTHIQSCDTGNNNNGTSFMAKIAIAIGIAATMTLISVGINRSNLGSLLGFQFLSENSYSSAMPIDHLGFSFKAFGYKIILPEYAPGWIYFWLLMAAGFGLFISEEALNIWVGISLARLLTLDGSGKSFAESFSRNSGYIVSTILWVYWGVCISDMIPFYLGKLFRQSGASDDVCSKLGVGKEKALSITSAVQKYGNLISFVERFSLGVRNPTSFLAGASGISPECFFAGVCCGGLITLPIQLIIGFFMRERPIFALATVATVVGIWTIFPYAVAASTALFLFVQRRHIL